MKPIEYNPLVVVHREASTSIDAVHIRLRLIISEKPTCFTVNAGLQIGSAAVCPAPRHASMTAGRIDLSATNILSSPEWFMVSIQRLVRERRSLHGATHAEFIVSRERLCGLAQSLWIRQ